MRSMIGLTALRLSFQTAGNGWNDQYRKGAHVMSPKISIPAFARLCGSTPLHEAIMAAMKAGDGPMTRADLATYTVRERVALTGDIGPWRLLSMPPPSSGGVASQQILGLLERNRNSSG